MIRAPQAGAFIFYSIFINLLLRGPDAVLYSFEMQNLEELKKQDLNEPLMTRALFERVYKRFKRPIWKYVSRSVNNDDIAEELTQEIFFKAFRYKDSYQSQFKFSTWLWSIARNTLIDWKRKNRTGAEVQFRAEGDAAPFDIEQAPGKEPDMEHVIIEREKKEKILALTGKLTEMQKKVLFMRLVDQLSYTEISRQLDLTLSAAKCLFHRAKCSLADAIGERPSEWQMGLAVGQTDL